MTRRLLLAALLMAPVVTGLNVPLAAQSFAIPPGARAEAPDPNIPLYFEAASIKLNKEGGPGRRINRAAGGRFSTGNAPINMLITFAYQIQGYQLVGLPNWASNDGYDIVAKLEGDPPPVNPAAGPDHMMLAMRTLLADRFKLKVHKETRQLDIYALVMARAGGKPGPALKPSTDMCGQQGVGQRSQGAPPGPPPTRADGTPVFCGVRQQPGAVQMNGMPLSMFASSISPRLGRQVVDRTGLTGEWSFDLTFAPMFQGPPPPGVELPPADPGAPDLFTAVQEQLGLKLESTKGPVEVYVVDSIERPSED
jgi:uncharacterized protein (TIGR03435 family)